VTVSIALIVKNEERTLARCLDSIHGAVDEIVVIDTGSVDATVSVARRYTDRIFDFPWIDDFAAARQFAFDHATSDWVAWVDADDVVHHADRIRPLCAAAPANIAGFYWRYVLVRDAAGAPTFEFWRERCVRNDGNFRWQGRVHEALVARTPAQLVRSDEVVVEHLPEEDRGADQHGRNLRILEAECADAGETVEPRKLFYLGREYADMGQPEQALAVLRRYLDVAFWDDERYRAQTQVAALLRALERYPEAIDADLAALKIHPRWPDAYFGLAESYYYLRDWPKVIHWADIGRALPLPDTTLFLDRRNYSYRWIIHYTNALYHTGDIAAALDWTRRALELAPDDPWHQRNLIYFAEQLSLP
jgi:glycosyltransferase involved in cell wall biosynthesis